MAELIAPLPRTTLSPGMSIVLEAIDPTTGDAVSGVTVSGLAIYAETAAPDAETQATVIVDLPELAPLWAPTPAVPE